MRPSVASRYQPLIKFLGKHVEAAVDHTPRPHPMAPAGVLPSAGGASSSAGAGAGASTAQFTLRLQLPARFRYKPIEPVEIDNVNEGGAAVVF